MTITKTLVGAFAAAFLLTSTATAETTLVTSTVNAVGSLHNRMGNMFRDLVAAQGADLIINHVEGEVLGNAPQVMDQVIAGTVNVMGTDMTWVAPFNPDLAVLNWSFAFRNTDHLDAFFQSDPFAEIVESIAQGTGVRVLAARSGQPRHFFSRVPISSADDIRGLKVRVPQIAIFINSWEAMGAVPTPLNFGEVFLGMSTGVIDAAFGAPSDTFANNFHASGPNIVPLGDTMSSYTLVVNEATFQSLTDVQRTALIAAATEAVEWASAEARREMEGLLEQMVATGATITEIDSASLRQRALEAGVAFEAGGAWSAGLLDRIQAIN